MTRPCIVGELIVRISSKYERIDGVVRLCKVIEPLLDRCSEYGRKCWQEYCSAEIKTGVEGRKGSNVAFYEDGIYAACIDTHEDADYRVVSYVLYVDTLV